MAPGLAATALPFLIDDELTLLRAHFARGNPHWRTIDGADGMMIVPSADAYVSPRWYPSKAVDGKVVPTWNYELVHLHGTIEIHDDAAWKRQVVEDLTVHNERRASAVWTGRGLGGRRRTGRIHRAAAQGDRRRGVAHRPDRRQAQAQPEQVRVGSCRCGRRPRTVRQPPRSASRLVDAPHAVARRSTPKA